MGKMNWDEYFAEKKNMITLIVLLSILAIFVIRNSVSEMQTQWLDEKHSIIAENEAKIEVDKKIILLQSNKISPDGKHLSTKNPQLVAQYDKLLTDINDYSLKNLYIYYVDFKDEQTTKNKMQELRIFINKNKIAPSYDKFVQELDDFYNNLPKYKTE